eukprot:GGOE01029899.1.p4 GENE.GGOE01029899.1~~GGOE01029899.1.p4  ORF type:complete len:132 (-),score=0.66 GGOE01029899.1:475-870(-)
MSTHAMFWFRAPFMPELLHCCSAPASKCFSSNTPCIHPAVSLYVTVVCRQCCCGLLQNCPPSLLASAPPMRRSWVQIHPHLVQRPLCSVFSATRSLAPQFPSPPPHAFSLLLSTRNAHLYTAPYPPTESSK